MIIRSLLLLLPLCVWAWLIIQPRWSSRDITAMFFGFVWFFLASLIINILFINKGTLSFSIHENLFYGVPIDWVISQSIIMGSLVPLLRLWNLKIAYRILIQFSLVFLTYSPEYVNLYGLTLTALVVLVTAIAAVPAMFLSDWTMMDISVGKRSTLQSLGWAVFLFWFFPSTIFQLTADNWSVFLHRDMVLNGLYLIPLLLPGYLLISALYQFAVHGDGTGFPYDPPKRLVTQGVYRYISNPMQVGISLAMGWWGLVIESLWVSVSAGVAVVLFLVFRDVCNGSCAIGLNNPDWEEYQRSVPKWFPRRKF